VEYGACSYLYQANEAMMDNLKRFFPETWKTIFTLAALKCIGETSLKRVQACYETGYLCVLFPRLGLSAPLLTNIMRELGKNRDGICSYMRNGLSSYSGFILVDGHRIISEPANMPLLQMRYKPQVNLLYLFGRRDGMRLPLYYKQFSGSVPDCLALPDIADEAGIGGSEITVIADKGFGAEDDFRAITESGMHYIIPLRRNTTEVQIPENTSLYPNAFNFRQRSVFWTSSIKDGYKVVVYYDMLLAMHETNDLICRLEKKNNTMAAMLEKEEIRRSKGKRRLTDEQIAAMQSIDVAGTVQQRNQIGNLILKTDRLDLDESQLYALYKTRQEIEQNFKCYDDTLDLDTSFMQDQDAFEGWLFINHLALQMLYGILDYIAQTNLTVKYSFKDVVRTLKGIRANKINGQWRLTQFTKNIRKLCTDLNIKIDGLLVG
jgi:transposase